MKFTARKYKIQDTSTYLFLLVLFAWNFFGVIGIYTLNILSKLNIVSYNFEYPKLESALLYQFYFGATILIAQFLFKRKKKPVFVQKEKNTFNDKRNKNLLILITLTNLFILFKNGLVLLSGDYQARFNIDASAIEKVYVPYVCWGLFMINVYVNKVPLPVFFKKYKFYIGAALLTSVLIATRGFAFLSLVSFIHYAVYVKDLRVNRKFILYFFLIFFSVYILGQLLNVIRVFGTSFSTVELIRTFNEDSFNEIRSFSNLLLEPRINDLDYNIVDYVQEFVSRIVPSFLYGVMDLDRMDYWNKSWNTLSPIIWGNSEALYGIRLGLVGDIYIYLGKWFIPLFGMIYGILFLIKSKYSNLIVTFAIFSIPYGSLSFSFLALIILVDKIVALKLKK